MSGTRRQAVFLTGYNGQLCMYVCILFIHRICILSFLRHGDIQSKHRLVNFCTEHIEIFDYIKETFRKKPYVVIVEIGQTTAQCVTDLYVALLMTMHNTLYNFPLQPFIFIKFFDTFDQLFLSNSKAVWIIYSRQTSVSQEATIVLLATIILIMLRNQMLPIFSSSIFVSKNSFIMTR